MERGLYIAASGMLAEQVRQDQIAADLANTSTPGYKADRSAQKSFGELLLSNQKDGSVVGALGLATLVDKTVTSLDQAPLRQTNGPLDLALEGEGFFGVRTPQGVRYTRDGQFSVDVQGRLVTAVGRQPVLDQQSRPIVIGQTTKLEVAADGAISSAGRVIGRVGVFGLTNAAKQGDNLFTGTVAARPAQTQVQQGFLEQSGVDAARSMIDMIASLRNFEASQRVIHAIDETLGRGIQGASGS
jgi:flagellar basal-body rod protein FlgG